MKIDLQLSGAKAFISITDLSYNLYIITRVAEINNKTGKPNKNAGTEQETVFGYYTNLPSAIERAIQIGLSTKEETVTLREFIAEYKEAKAIINQPIK